MSGYRIEIDAPEVPYPGETKQADFIRSAALNIEQGYPVGGSNVTRTVIDLLLSVATAMEKQAPRIPEPGLWGVVEAHTGDGSARRRFVRHDDAEDGREWERKGVRRAWSDLIDPTLIREGVDS